VGVAFTRFQTRYFQGRYGNLDVSAGGWLGVQLMLVVQLFVCAVAVDAAVL